MPPVCKSTTRVTITNRGDSLPGKVLILSSFDANAMKARNNKKELFEDLGVSLRQLLYDGVQKEYLLEAGIHTELFPETNSDSVLFSLMGNNNATRAIVIRNIDIYFDQTRVDVRGTKNNKTRTAYYDICAVITYEFYSKGTKFSSERKNCEFYTKRNVVSGLLAAGPDIVGKRKDAFKMMEKNARQYFSEIAYELTGQ